MSLSLSTGSEGSDSACLEPQHLGSEGRRMGNSRSSISKFKGGLGYMKSPPTHTHTRHGPQPSHSCAQVGRAALGPDCQRLNEDAL